MYQIVCKLSWGRVFLFLYISCGVLEPFLLKVFKSEASSRVVGRSWLLMWRMMAWRCFSRSMSVLRRLDVQVVYHVQEGAAWAQGVKHCESFRGGPQKLPMSWECR